MFKKYSHQVTGWLIIKRWMLLQDIWMLNLNECYKNQKTLKNYVLIKC